MSINCEFGDDLKCVHCGWQSRSQTTRKNCKVLMGIDTPSKAGVELHAIFESLDLVACMKCLRIAAEMNSRGLDWCRENVDHIAAQIKENAKELSWSTWFVATGKAALAGYSSIEQMVEEAIRRAERKLKESKG